jgi:hypothetical protein
MRKFLTLMLCLMAVPAAARPMWEVAGQWTCALELHVKMDAQGGNVRAGEESGAFTYDFVAGTATSPFGGATATIGDRHYYEGEWANFNVIELRWNGEPYPVIIKEERGGFWEATTSGLAGYSGQVWMAAYQCEPGLNG